MIDQQGEQDKMKEAPPGATAAAAAVKTHSAGLMYVLCYVLFLLLPITIYAKQRWLMLSDGKPIKK